MHNAVIEYLGFPLEQDEGPAVQRQQITDHEPLLRAKLKRGRRPPSAAP